MPEKRKSKLHQSQDLYRSIVEDSPLGIVIVDREGKIVDINKAFLDMLGSPSKQATKAINVLELPQLKEAGFSDDLKKSVDQGVQVVSEYQYMSVWGKKSCLKIHISPMVSSEGAVVGAQAVAEDISVIKEMEAALRDSEEKYSGLVETAMDGILVAQDGVFQYVNHAMATMLGCNKEDLVGKAFLDYVHPDHRELLKQRYQDRIVGMDIPNPVECKIVRVDGESRDVEISGNLMYFQDRPADMAFLRDITKRKLIEKLLLDEKSRTLKYLDSAAVVVVVLDAGGHISLINRKACEVLGCSEEEAIHADWFKEFLPENIKEKIRLGYEKLIKGEVEMAKYVESPVITRKGEQRLIAWQNAILTDEQDLIIGVISSGTDITESSRMREEIYLRAQLLDLATDSIYVFDLQGNIFYVNDNMCKTRGYTAEEMLGMNVRQLADVENAKKAEARLYNMAEKGDSAFESVHVRKDGSSFPVEVHGRVINRGGMQLVIGVTRDITERKMVEEVLKRSEERFRTILEDMENGYFELDLRGSYIFINDAMCRILGRPRDEIIARHFAGFIDPLDNQLADNVSKITEGVLKSGSIVSGLFASIIKGDGSKRIIGFSASPMRNMTGDIIGARGISRDITDRMKMEQQLLIASKLASIGELAAGVAHEINNPLTAIMGYAQLMVMDESLPEEARADLEKIYSQSQRAARIVQNLLTFARSHSLENRPVKINELLLKTLDMRDYEHKVNNIRVVTTLAEDLPEIWVDETQIQQVVLNIVVNAEQAIASRGRSGRISVTTQQENDKIKIVISDNGPGIPEEMLDKLFDPFFTTKEVGQGTGLGLSVCHGIVTKHGGRIYAESEEGRGATFNIELPVTKQQKPAVKHEPAPQIGQAVKSGIKMKVLVVDDEMVIRDIMTRILTEKGYEIDTAATGVEGLKKIDANEYGAYLLDIKMPGIDGKDMYEMIEKKSPMLAERVIFITGDTITKSTQDFLESASRLYLSKPLDFSRLLNYLSEI